MIPSVTTFDGGSIFARPSEAFVDAPRALPSLHSTSDNGGWGRVDLFDGFPIAIYPMLLAGRMEARLSEYAVKCVQSQ